MQYQQPDEFPPPEGNLDEIIFPSGGTPIDGGNEKLFEELMSEGFQPDEPAYNCTTSTQVRYFAPMPQIPSSHEPMYAPSNSPGTYALSNSAATYAQNTTPEPYALVPYAPSSAPVPHASNSAPVPYAPSSAPVPHVPSSAPVPHVPSSAPMPYAPRNAPVTYAHIGLPMPGALLQKTTMSGGECILQQAMQTTGLIGSAFMENRDALENYRRALNPNQVINVQPKPIKKSKKVPTVKKRKLYEMTPFMNDDPNEKRRLNALNAKQYRDRQRQIMDNIAFQTSQIKEEITSLQAQKEHYRRSIQQHNQRLGYC